MKQAANWGGLNVATAAAGSSVSGRMSVALVAARLNDRALSPPSDLGVRDLGQHNGDLGDRRLRSDGAIPTSTKTISFAGYQFDPAQLGDSEAAGAFTVDRCTPHDTGAGRHAVSAQHEGAV